MQLNRITRDGRGLATDIKPVGNGLIVEEYLARDIPRVLTTNPAVAGVRSDRNWFASRPPECCLHNCRGGRCRIHGHHAAAGRYDGAAVQLDCGGTGRCAHDGAHAPGQVVATLLGSATVIWAGNAGRLSTSGALSTMSSSLSLPMIRLSTDATAGATTGGAKSLPGCPAH